MVLYWSPHGTGCRPLHSPPASPALDLSRLSQPRFQLLVLQRHGVAHHHGCTERRWRAAERDRAGSGNQAREEGNWPQKGTKGTKDFCVNVVPLVATARGVAFPG